MKKKILSLVFMVIFIPIFFYPIIGNAEEGGDNPPAETVEAPADEKPAENVKTDVSEKSDDKKTGEEAKTEKPEVPEDFNEAVETTSDLVKAVQAKNWPVVAGLILMMLVFLANKFGLKDKVGAKVVPWVALGVGVATTTGLALVSGTAVPDAIWQGLAAGLAAVGSWETVFKHMLGGAKEEEEPTA